MFSQLLLWFMSFCHLVCWLQVFSKPNSRHFGWWREAETSAQPSFLAVGLVRFTGCLRGLGQYSQYTQTPSHQSVLYWGFRTTTISEPRPLMSGSQQGHHPSLQFSLCISVHQYPSPTRLLQPIFPTFPIPLPPPALPREGSIKGCHGNDRAEVIEELLIWWWRCDVTPCFLLESVIVGICHVRVTFSSPPILPALFCPSFCRFLQPRHAIKLLSVLNQMPQRHGPDTFFNFPGRSAAVSLTMLQNVHTRLGVLMKTKTKQAVYADT